MKNKRNIVFGVLGIVLILLIIGASYAVYNYQFKGNANLITTETIEFELLESESEVINIEKAFPMRDEDGKKQEETYDFSVTTKTKAKSNIDYFILMQPLEVDAGYTALEDDKIKVYLEDYEGNVLIEPTKISDTLNYLLYQDTNKHNKETPKIENKFKLRVWIDEEVDASSWTKDTKLQYKFKIAVVGADNFLLYFDKNKNNNLNIVETMFDYDKNRDGVFLDVETGEYHEKVLDVVKSLDYVAIKISDELYDPSFQYKVTIDSGSPEYTIGIKGQDIFTMMKDDNGYWGYLQIDDYWLNYVALLLIETPYIDSGLSADKEFSRGTWFYLVSADYYALLNNLKIEKVGQEVDKITIEETTLYRLSDTYFKPYDFIDSFILVEDIAGGALENQITESDISFEDESNFVITLEDLVLYVADGSSEIPEGIWIESSLYPFIKNIIIMKQ